MFVLKVAGDSMISAAIADGDWVVVREQDYLAFAAELGEHVAIYMRPQRWLSGDLGPG